MRGFAAIYRRDLAGYLATPLAPVFIVIFLALSAALTFYAGGFFARGQADLVPFFAFHPWLYLLFVPAVAMRLWAEEAQSGTIELLLTLPVGTGFAVLAKFLAAWTVVALALLCTTPLWATVAWLGDPDDGAILAGYLGSFLMAGAYLAIGEAASAATRHQVVAFVIGVALAALLTLPGAPALLVLAEGVAPPGLIEAIARFGILAHFSAILRGVMDLRDIVYFTSLIVFFLFAATLAVDARRAR
jgi:ABC-2 type transport system permease protein